MLGAIARSYRDAFSGLPRQVWVLSAVLFVNRLGMMVLPFLELYLAEERGLAVDVAGRLVALYGVGSILGVTIGGHLTDRYGPRRVQLASLIGQALFLMTLGLVRRTELIALSIVATSLSSDSFRPANASAISAAVGPESRARAFSLMSLAVSVGLTIGMPVGGMLADIDYRWLFPIDAGTSLLAALVLWSFGSRAPCAVPHEETPRTAVPSPWRDPLFLSVVLLQCATATVLFQFFGALPVFLKEDLGFEESGVGRALAVNSVLIVLFEMQVIRRVEHRSALPFVGLGALLIGLGYGVNALAGGASVALLSIVLWTCGEFFFFPLGAAFASRRAPANAVGRYMSVYHLGFAVPMILAPLLGTALYEHQGPRTLWASCALVGVLVFVAYLVLQRRMDAATARAESR